MDVNPEGTYSHCPWGITLSSADAVRVMQLARESVAFFSPADEDPRSVHIRERDTYGSFMAEFALHMLTGAPWFAGRKDFGTAADVGPWQVKSTIYEEGHLLVPAVSIRAEMPYLLAIVGGRRAEFRGWQRGAKLANLANETPPMELFEPHYWVPQAELEAMDTLAHAGLALRPIATSVGELEFAVNSRLQALSERRVQLRRPEFAPGVAVHHSRHGLGRVTAIKRHRNKIELTVTFSTGRPQLFCSDGLDGLVAC